MDRYMEHSRTLNMQDFIKKNIFSNILKKNSFELKN